MTDSQFDTIFKNQLPDHESPVPEDMWERIIRKKDKDRKGFLFFFGLSGLFILGLGIAGILLYKTSKKPATQEGQETSKSKPISIPSTINSKTTDPNLIQAPSLKKEKTHRGMDTVLRTYKRKDYLKRAMLSENKHAVIRQAQLVKDNKPTGTLQTQAGKDSEAILDKETGSVDSSVISDQKAKPTSSSSYPKSLTSDSSTKAALTKSKPGPKSLAADTSIKSTVKRSEPAKETTRKKWSLDLYASPDYPIDSRGFIRPKLSYTAGLRINRSFGTHFSGRIGIQFSQINYTDSNGIDFPYNLKSIDLPVLAGYSWGSEILGMTINAGVVFNLYTWPGDYVDYFKTNTGLSLYLGFNVKKQISDRIDIFTEPYYRYRLSSMTVSSVYYTKFIDVAGLSFGVRYHFKK